MVEGALASTIFLRPERSSTYTAPSTTLRAVPLPRFAGADEDHAAFLPFSAIPTSARKISVAPFSPSSAESHSSKNTTFWSGRTRAPKAATRWIQPWVQPLGSALLALAEERRNVAMAFDYGDDFEHVAGVTKENNIGFVRVAAQTRAKFVARAAHEYRSSGERVTFLTKLVDEAPRRLAAAALLPDISVDLTKVVARGCRIANVRHDQRPFRSASACICSI